MNRNTRSQVRSPSADDSSMSDAALSPQMNQENLLPANLAPLSPPSLDENKHDGDSASAENNSVPSTGANISTDLLVQLLSKLSSPSAQSTSSSGASRSSMEVRGTQVRAVREVLGLTND